MKIREYVNVFLEHLEKQVGHLTWEIEEDSKEIRVYALIDTVVGPRKVEINFADGDRVYACVDIAKNFSFDKISQHDFEKIMICINRINSWYSNTLVAIAEPLDDGWDVFIRGLVAPIDNHVIDKNSKDLRLRLELPLVAVVSFMDSAKNSFGATYLEDYISFFEGK